MSKVPQIVVDDPWLNPYVDDINARTDRFKTRLALIEKYSGRLFDFAAGHLHFGFNFNEDGTGVYYREWAPAAHRLELIGDFNSWNGEHHALDKKEGGIWEIFISTKDLFNHSNEAKLKVRVHSDMGVTDRIPAYTKQTIQDPNSHDFSALLSKNVPEFKWKNTFTFSEGVSPIIYEAHTGLAQEEAKVGSYKEFEENILPRIKKAGYNCIQLMAVQEHPYYGSFGYHVSNFFAISSRFGTANELKSLIDTAHKMGIAVVMDIVHSHAIKNYAEGLNNFDGSGGQYFHEGERGDHPQWDSKIFHYGKDEVLQFLLSNLRYWLEEFHFDGFRFDGITSMLYHNHGIETFDHYDKYFKGGIEWDAITYIQLANTLIKEINPSALIIAEDMSGMPGLCRTIEDGGLGFDYRLGMGIPDYWIKILKHLPDEQWDLGELWGMLSNRRANEKTISYTESHDQALVGDKTLAFWLMDKEMYFHMSTTDNNLVIDRGVALHKMIRLITATVGGEAYLNFIGNEFGHPEWLDFPREGNDWSYDYCRRQWSLADNEELKYKFLANFDQSMVQFLKTDGFLNSSPAQLLHIDVNNQILIYERFNYLFIFSFNVAHSISDYELPVHTSGEYETVLNTDDKTMGGFSRIEGNKLIFKSFLVEDVPKIKIYIPNRMALILKKK